MTKLESVCTFLEQFAPPELAEHWDNVGLLAGDPSTDIQSVMTCLTITPASANEAIESGANLIVTHHPLPFHPLKSLTTRSHAGRLLWDLVSNRIAIYSPHTSFDSAEHGINQRLAEGLGLDGIAPLVPFEDASEQVGSGRYGRLVAPLALADLVAQLKSFLQIANLQAVGQLDRQVQNVAVACGAAGQFVGMARDNGCHVLVTGETNLHTCIEADAAEIALLLPGHFASERFAVESLADVLASQFRQLSVWASRREKDPLRWV